MKLLRASRKSSFIFRSSQINCDPLNFAPNNASKEKRAGSTLHSLVSGLIGSAILGAACLSLAACSDEPTKRGGTTSGYSTSQPRSGDAVAVINGGGRGGFSVHAKNVFPGYRNVAALNIPSWCLPRAERLTRRPADDQKRPWAWAISSVSIASWPGTSAPMHTSPTPEPRDGEPLANFYRALAQLQSGVRRRPVTVLHLGDSHIASDGLTRELRRLLQARFGDAGRGMLMPAGTFKNYYRPAGVRLSRSGPWTYANSLFNKTGPYGITGVRATASSSAAKMSLSVDGDPYDWAEFTFLGQPNGGSVRVTAGGETQVVATRSSDIQLKRVRLAAYGKTIKIQPVGNGKVTVLSWAVGRERPGIRYINLGIPGATALTTRRWNMDLVTADVEHLAPDLLVLGYATNEGFNDGLNIRRYREYYSRFLAQLRAHAPQASVLILGPSDAARRRSRGASGAGRCRPLSDSERANYSTLRRSKGAVLARWHPPPKLAPVRSVLMEIARDSGAEFWDWKKVTGGACGLHDWVQAKLAAKDHVHFTRAGYRKSARALFKDMMAPYKVHRVASTN